LNYWEDVVAQTIQIVVPMAGYGSRMRPHTWSKAKPLIEVAGKTVIDFVLAQFKTLSANWQPEYVFVVSPFQLDQVNSYIKEFHSEKKVFYVVQEIMRGQADALFLARDHLHGPMLMSFSDTLIETDLAVLDSVDYDGLAWVKPVPDPRRFGVAAVDPQGWVTRMIEKPQDVENNRAVVGFYYFRSGDALMQSIQEQMQRNISLKNEFFLTDSINVMLEHGARFRTQTVDVWLDAGIPDALLEANRYYLDHGYDNSAKAALRPGVAVIPPVYIAPDAQISASVIGPHVSIGSGVKADHVVISDSIVETGASLSHQLIKESHIGRNVVMNGIAHKLEIGDNSSVK
jgi:glucose-1-phosphate thymidylyltransferase